MMKIAIPHARHKHHSISKRIFAHLARHWESKLLALARKSGCINRAKGIAAAEIVMRDNQSYAARNHTEAELFIRLQVADMIAGAGDAEKISVLHSWLGHMLHIALCRAKKLPRRTIAYQELRQNTVPMLCRGRRALQSCWLRFDRIGKVGFAGRELEQFKSGIEEGLLLSKHASRKEVRAAFVYADKMAKIKNLELKNAEYHY